MFGSAHPAYTIIFFPLSRKVDRSVLIASINGLRRASKISTSEPQLNVVASYERLSNTLFCRKGTENPLERRPCTWGSDHPASDPNDSPAYIEVLGASDRTAPWYTNLKDSIWVGVRQVEFSAWESSVQAKVVMSKEQASGFSINLSATPSMVSHLSKTRACTKSRTESGIGVASICVHFLVRTNTKFQ